MPHAGAHCSDESGGLTPVSGMPPYSYDGTSSGGSQSYQSDGLTPGGTNSYHSDGNFKETPDGSFKETPDGSCKEAHLLGPLSLHGGEADLSKESPVVGDDDHQIHIEDRMDGDSGIEDAVLFGSSSVSCCCPCLSSDCPLTIL